MHFLRKLLFFTITLQLSPNLFLAIFSHFPSLHPTIFIMLCTIALSAPFSPLTFYKFTSLRFYESTLRIYNFTNYQSS